MKLVRSEIAILEVKMFDKTKISWLIIVCIISAVIIIGFSLPLVKYDETFDLDKYSTSKMKWSGEGEAHITMKSWGFKRLSIPAIIATGSYLIAYFTYAKKQLELERNEETDSWENVAYSGFDKPHWGEWVALFFSIVCLLILFFIKGVISDEYTLSLTLARLIGFWIILAGFLGMTASIIIRMTTKKGRVKIVQD